MENNLMREIFSVFFTVIMLPFIIVAVLLCWVGVGGDLILYFVETLSNKINVFHDELFGDINKNS